MSEPTRKEDAKNLSAIAGAGILAALLSLALLARTPRSEVEYHLILLPVATEAATLEPVVESTPVLENNRLYGRVLTRSGDEYRGYIRWDRNEASWADLLDAGKSPLTDWTVDTRRRSENFYIVSSLAGSTKAGIRFGHIRRIQALNSHSARLTLKSGEEVELIGRNTDLGSGLRALVVEDPEWGVVEMAWRDLDEVEFMEAPDGSEPRARRLYGTLKTTSGLEFTGYVAWDVDEILESDVLDGEDTRGLRREIPFGAVRSIARFTSSGAWVALESGEEMVLTGDVDVTVRNRGITISDPGLGQVKVKWHQFASLRFHEAQSHAGYGRFDGGRRLHGTVLTVSGEELTGDIRWDDDESHTWEMLDGSAEGVELSVEFGRIASIRKDASGGVRVELLDGRAFSLSGSNDVNRGNRGVFVTDEAGETRVVEFRHFVELRLEG